MSGSPHSPKSRSLLRLVVILFHGTTLTLFVAAAAAPTPLYHLYQEAWDLTPTMVTVVFGVYALALLTALLTFGSLSDRIGRRPVIFLALLFESGAMILFMGADGFFFLLLARLLQGLATGTATSALAASVMDLTPKGAPVINGIIPPLGLTFGVLGSAALVTFAPAPMHLVYWTLLAGFSLLAGLIWLTPEPGRRPKEQAKGSAKRQDRFWSRWTLPQGARRAFWRVTPANMTIWALGGFYLSLVPSVVRTSLESTSPLIGGSVVATLTAMGALAVLSTRRRPPERALMEGPSALAVGVALTIAGVQGHVLGFIYLGTAVAGFGWGMGFLGVLGCLMPSVSGEDKARLMALYYTQSYGAQSLPTLIAGMLATNLGLSTATLIYGGVLILSAIAAVALSQNVARGRQFLSPRGPRHCPEES